MLSEEVYQLEKQNKTRTAIQPKKKMTHSHKNGYACKKRKNSKITTTTSATFHQITPCCGGLSGTTVV